MQRAGVVSIVTRSVFAMSSSRSALGGWVITDEWKCHSPAPWSNSSPSATAPSSAAAGGQSRCRSSPCPCPPASAAAAVWTDMRSLSKDKDVEVKPNTTRSRHTFPCPSHRPAAADGATPPTCQAFFPNNLLASRLIATTPLGVIEGVMRCQQQRSPMVHITVP